MKKLLFVIDMQNDFIDGALGTKEAQAILPAVIEKVKTFDGDVIFTRDTHFDNYLDTQEGKNLPVPHCIKGTPGWELAPALEALRLEKNAPVFDKLTFGCKELPVSVNASLCAGVTPQSHENALEAMKMCQIHICQVNVYRGG